MKSLFVIFSCLAVSAASKGVSREKCEDQSIKSVLPGGDIVDTCAFFTVGLNSSQVYEDQKCNFAEDDDNSTKFKYCYFSFIEEERSDCIDTGLASYLMQQEYPLFVQCQEKHKEKCCMAGKEERPEACLDLMNCFIYCSLDCKELCPLVAEAETKEKKRSHARSHGKSHHAKSKSKHGKTKNH